MSSEAKCPFNHQAPTKGTTNRDWWPKHLEMAGRHATYRPDNSIRKNLQDETTLTFNWFFKGHKNKLTSEVTYFSFQDKTLPLEAGWRFRIQWDISL